MTRLQMHARNHAAIDARPEPAVGRAPMSAAGTLDALFLLNALSGGGSERKVLRIANRLVADGLHIGVAALNGPDTLGAMLDEQVPRWELERTGKFSFAALRRLRALVAGQRPRVLFAVNLYPALYVALAGTGLGRAAPVTVGLVNTTDPGPRARWRQPLYKQILQRLDWLVYGCEIQREVWSGGSGRLRTRAGVIYNGVNHEQFRRESLADSPAALRLQCGYPRDAFVIGSVGRLVAAKNHEVLLDSVAQLRRDGIDARLVIAGEGPLRPVLEARAAQLGITSFVRLAGAVEDVRPLLATLDVFALPSLYVETFSNAALEAMAMGTPVVLSQVGGAAEMVRDGDDGLLVEPQRLQTQLPRLLQALAREPARRRLLGERARQRVERDFSFQGMVERYAELIRRFAA